MFKPNEIERFSMALDPQMKKLEERIMEDIVRRIKINGEITRAADWQINRLQQLGVSMKTVENEIQRALNFDDADMEKLYSDIAERGYARDSKLYEATGKHRIPFEENAELQQLISSVANQTNETMRNITQSLGFAVRQPDGRVGWSPLAQYYQKTLDGAMLDIASGAFDYNTVLKRVVSEMTNSGLRTIDYATGHKNRVDVAARRALMTGMSQITAKINADNMEALDTEYVEVSWHGGARPSHQEWQGKVYRWRRGGNTGAAVPVGSKPPKVEYASPMNFSGEEAERLTGGKDSDIINTEEKLKSIGFDKVDSSFFKNVNKDMQSAITDQLTLLEEKFKAISKSNKPTISADLKGGSTACVRSELDNPENQKLMLSSRQFKNRKRHIDDRRREVEDFFCMPCNTDDETLSRYVITHEYGHMLENSIAAQDMKGTINTFPRLTERYREQIEKIARTIDADYDKNKSKYLSVYVRERTPYGKKNLEFFAECFANSQLGQPNVLGQAMLQWLEKRGFNVL